MERAEFGEIFRPLVKALAFRGDLDAGQWAAYEAALQELPARWLRVAVKTALRQPRRGMPSPGELYAFATEALRAEQAKVARPDCDDCNNTGWREVQDDRGVTRACPCDCVTRFRERVAALGTIAAPKLLSAASEEESFV